MDKEEELRQWFDIAGKDLTSAEILLNNMHPVPDEIVCFHCQQSVEKYLKGFMFLHDTIPPKIHDLVQLLNLCVSIQSDFSTLLSKCTFINRFSVLPRYPNELQINDNDVRLALQYAKDIKAFIESQADCSFIAG
ncbi:hypothetical protein FACS1894190_10080 [Spirochaetia bacterium]|nr:hypothetical protein FACS1894190_10080 [Spirochaetia bacterium]